MVNTVTNYGRSGLYEWFFQRVTAVAITLYFVFLHYYLLVIPTTYEAWFGLYCNGLFKISSTLIFVCIIIHAWIGLWTVLTDYLKIVKLRAFCQIVANTIFFICFIVFVDSLWFTDGLW